MASLGDERMRTGAHGLALKQLLAGLIVGRTILAPVRLIDLIVDSEFFLDVHVKLPALNAALSSLVESGKAKEVPGPAWVDGRSGHGERFHLPIDEQMYLAASAQRNQAISPNQPCLTISLTGRWLAPQGGWQLAEDLAVDLCGQLRAQGVPATVVSIAAGAETLTFTLLADANRDPDKVARVVEPIIAARGLGSDAIVKPARLPLP